MNLFRTPWLHQPQLSRSRYSRGAGTSTGYRDRAARNRASRRDSEHEASRLALGGFRTTRT